MVLILSRAHRETNIKNSTVYIDLTNLNYDDPQTLNNGVLVEISRPKLTLRFNKPTLSLTGFNRSHASIRVCQGSKMPID